MRKLIYVMGSSYSGSTLLTRLLASLPQVASVGELKATAMGDIATYSCSCGALLNDCSFWTQVKEEMARRGRIFTYDNFGTHFQADDHLTNRLLRWSIRGPIFEAIRGLGFVLSGSAKNTRQKIIEQNMALIEIICNLLQADTFLDDSKDPVRLKFFLGSGLWDIRTIHLIRDGRGVTNSYIRHNRSSMKTAVQEWVHAQQECDRMARSLGDRCLTIYYEDLCLTPKTILSAIHKFIGFNDPCEELNCLKQDHHILGNQMRLGTLQEIRLDEKWKQSLSPEQLLIFDDIGGELNRSYGYRQ